jgi:hypothetical protein
MITKHGIGREEELPVATTICINGILEVGDIVISAPDDAYSCLIGRVMQINLFGSAEHDEETANETDDVHVNFLEFDYSEKRIAEIEEMFFELCGEKKGFNECSLDDVIMPPDSLICISHIDESCLQRLLQNGYNAACFCYGSLIDVRRGR